MNQEQIYVMDFGGQYTQLIAKAVRQCGVFSEIKPHDYGIEKIVNEQPKGIILSGGPDSVYEKGSPLADKGLFELGIPVLGICYGMQQINYTLLKESWLNRWLLNYAFGDGILHGKNVVKEFGETEVSLERSHPLFQGLDEKIIAWMSHGDSVDASKLAKGFSVIANTKNHVAAIANDKRKIYGVQFHPEVSDTQYGTQIVSNFVHDICGAGYHWTSGNNIAQSKKYLQDTVGNNDVLNLVSGGVDSSYVSKLVSVTEGLGNFWNVYIGALMRKGENEEVMNSLRNAGVKNLRFIDAESRFIEALKGISDPEQKRKIIGNLFGVIQQEVCIELGLDPKKTYLAQGTLYTDLIESGKGVGKKAHSIKSHHNASCPFIDEMQARGMVVEPNRMIFKDEVREAAKEIGLPPEIYERQPYPGPGLGIRIVNGDSSWVTEEFYDISDRVNRISRQEGLNSGFIVPVKTVGVQGDKRTYAYLAVLQGDRDWQSIRTATKIIPTRIPKVNRVIYAVSEHRPPNSRDIGIVIPTTVELETVRQLQEIDYQGRMIIGEHGFRRRISQEIFTLFGADPYKTGKRSAALRAVKTNDFMTVKPIAPDGINMSWQCLDDICREVMAKGNVGAFFIDVTDKPPSTTCWE